jgi:16S rRNA processing protein RimM
LGQFTSIAKITRTHGVRGEVTAIILTDFPDRFQKVERVRLTSADQSCWEELESYRFHKGRIILKFRGRERPHEVEELVGCEVQIPETERVELPENTYFDSDLIGCQVVEKDRLLGRVDDMLKSGGEVTNLVISTPQQGELMVPFVSAFVKEVDINEKRIRVKLPPGLTDL